MIEQTKRRVGWFHWAVLFFGITLIVYSQSHLRGNIVGRSGGGQNFGNGMKQSNKPNKLSRR